MKTKNKIRREYKKEIRAIRKSLGLTQHQLSKLIGKERSVIVRYEQYGGIEVPTTEYLQIMSLKK